ncbi:MAG: Rrf2 family transcriptional regulator [Slackia sp.]|nr:Rrf2 family transcriptional regulator [Slackia sp.]
MMISTKGRYAMRLMVDIAVNARQEPVSLKDVARREEMPLKYLEQLVRPLAREGLLKSVRGQRGGYLLARDASDISAGDILRAAEGTCAPIACLEGDEVSCPRARSCSTLSFWKGLDDAIEAYVDSVMVSDLASGHICMEEKPSS